MTKLDGVDPRLAEAVLRIHDAMQILGHPMIVTDGFRTTEQQQKLYAQGRTAPGAIVTQADGVTHRSKHQDGRAVDCAFLVDGRPSWDEGHPWALYGAMAHALRLVWGGTFSHPDRPHVEWPA